MNRNNIIVMLSCLLLSGIPCLITYQMVIKQQHKIAVVDAIRLVNGFNLKMELEQIAKVKLQAEGKQADSIENIVQRARATNSNEDEVRRLAAEYSLMKAKLQSDYEQSNRDINEQVWKRLNPMLDAYGKKNGLHLIVGANGMGSVLYTDEYYDRTNDIIQFVNKQYAGSN